MAEYSFSFSRKIDPCLLAKAESRNISVETLSPHLLAPLRCSDVTGERDDLLKGEPPVFGGVVDRSIINRIGTVLAKERIGGPNQALLQGCRGEKDFKKRTRFKHIRDSPVPPTFGAGLDELVWIERRIARHGKDLPGQGIHGNGHASLRPPFFNPSIQLRLGDMLNGFIDGEDDIPVMILFLKGGLAHGDLPAQGISGNGPYTVLSIEQGIVLKFNPLQTLRIKTYKTDQMRSEEHTSEL